MRAIAVAWFISLVLACGLSWYITKINVKPETVIVTQEKIIYRLQKDIEVEKIKAEVQYLIKIPFSDIGITLEHCQGFLGGIITGLVL